MTSSVSINDIINLVPRLDRQSSGLLIKFDKSLLAATRSQMDAVLEMDVSDELLFSPRPAIPHDVRSTVLFNFVDLLAGKLESLIHFE